MKRRCGNCQWFRMHDDKEDGNVGRCAYPIAVPLPMSVPDGRCWVSATEDATNCVCWKLEGGEPLPHCPGCVDARGRRRSGRKVIHTHHEGTIEHPGPQQNGGRA